MKLKFNASLHRISILLLLAVSTIFSSCSKSDDIPAPSPATVTNVTTASGTLSGPKNTIITITGTNFITDLSKIQVKVNGKDCAVLSATSTTITAKIPAACGTGNVVLILDGTSYQGPVFNFVNSYTLFSITDGQVGNVYGPLASAKFDQIESISIDANDNMYLGQYNFPKVKKISADGTVSLLAGSGVSGYLDANGAAAQFTAPEYCSRGTDGNVYVAENQYVRKIDASLNVTTLYTKATAGGYMAIKAMPGGIYLAGPTEIAKLSYSGTVIWAVQRKDPPPPFDNPYDFDGDTSVARFSTYGNIEVDAAEENIYFNNYDSYHTLNGHVVNKIKKLNIPSHTITTIAGAGAGAEVNDGPALQATFNQVSDLRLDQYGVLWIADSRNNRVRVLENGEVSTLIGAAGEGDVDGDAASGKIKFPTGLAFDSHGSLFIGCFGNNKIKKLLID